MDFKFVANGVRVLPRKQERNILTFNYFSFNYNTKSNQNVITPSNRTDKLAKIDFMQLWFQITNVRTTAKLNHFVT